MPKHFFRNALVALAIAAASFPAMSAGDPARGATLYESLCSGCHAHLVAYLKSLSRK